MKNIVYLLLILFVAQSAHAQKNIDNQLTSAHQQIPGTKLYLRPPAGFIEATNFQGFMQKTSSSSIMVVVIPGPFSEVSKGMNDKGFQSQGVVLKQRKEIKVNGYDGLWIKAEQFAHKNYFTKYILVFGDDTQTFMINSAFPREIKNLDNPIQEALQSVYYAVEADDDPLEAAKFKINTADTKLRFAKNVSNMLIFTVDGEIPTKSEDKTSLLAGQSITEQDIIDPRLFAINRIQQLPYDDISFDEDKIESITIDEVSGYAIKAFGKVPKTGEKELVYQVILFSDDLYYIMVGTAKAEFDENLILFKALISTFKRKE